MSSPTLDSLQTQVNTLLTRMAVLDGQGLTSPAVGYIQSSTAQLTGLKNDLDGATLALEAMIQDLTVIVQGIQASLNQLLGLNVTSSGGGFVTPPSS